MLTIAGFALDGNGWDGIYLGRRKGDDLIYAGKVDHGLDKKSSAQLRQRLTPLIRKTQPYTKRIAHKGIWVEPELLAEIENRAKSAEGAPSIFQGAAGGSMITTVWAYVNTIKQLGAPKHIKVFATTDTAETRFAGTTEGVALRVRGFGIRPATEAAYPLRGASRGGYGECEVSSSQGGP